jgi:hypothetical protein
MAVKQVPVVDIGGFLRAPVSAAGRAACASLSRAFETTGF